MLKKTIAYVDFNNEEVSEDHFFHLSQAELIELEMSVEGGFAETMQKVIKDEKGNIIIREFKKIILLAYGKKSPDGKRFIKNQQIREEFESSEAYSTLFVELVTNADAAAEFMKGILSSELAKRVGQEVTVDSSPNGTVEVAHETITRAELTALSEKEFNKASEKIREGRLTITSDLPGL